MTSTLIGGDSSGRNLILVDTSQVLLGTGDIETMSGRGPPAGRFFSSPASGRDLMSEREQELRALLVGAAEQEARQAAKERGETQARSTAERELERLWKRCGEIERIAQFNQAAHHVPKSGTPEGT